MMMTSRWYQEAVIYSLDVSSFQDSDGDGRGDLRGLISRLDYLSRLGVSCLWLNPIHPSPGRDGGYDISDYYGIDPALGSLGDFADLTRGARERGIRIILDLVVNHTSDEHPWFISARSSPDSPYRDWYVWSVEEPPNRHQGTVFPGEQTETWTFDEQAQAWYFHRFYDFQPDLNWANPAVRAEMAKVMSFWLQLGAAGFRIDAAPVHHRAGEAWRRFRPKGLLDHGLLAAGDPVAARRLGAAVRGQFAAERGRDVRRQPARRPERSSADDVRLPAQPARLAGAGSLRRGAAHRGPDHGGAAAGRWPVGQLLA